MRAWMALLIGGTVRYSYLFLKGTPPMREFVLPKPSCFLVRLGALFFPYNMCILAKSAARCALQRVQLDFRV